ncbi:hypothetical protein BJF80_00125 [Serinicoccus sp. CUA-874]|uniref:glycosyltransferase n=1 Tax=Serinicoccus sp. CUA-874 TaxID=1517939 RepID=UPI00095FB4F0|nr:hypothetical protein [Serinicoccus sp. CUA-874]OLT17784.1 hypothetical protein BJF80_00125 [Serinicoccus sp. CUA-874]
MAPTSPSAVEPCRPLLVLLALGGTHLPPVRWSSPTHVRVHGVVKEGSPPGDVDYPVHEVPAARRMHRRVRHDVQLQDLLRRADLVCSLDDTGDAVLAARARSLHDVATMSSDAWTTFDTAMGVLGSVLQHATRQEQPAGRRAVVEVEHLAQLYGEVLRAAAVASAVPPELRLAGAVARATRTIRTHQGFLAAERLTQVLDQARVSQDDRRRSGLAARRLSADLSRADRHVSGSALVDVGQVAEATLREADRRLEDGDQSQALDLLGDAMALLFNRALHAEVGSSPLVDEPHSFLEALWASTTFRRLVTRNGRRATPQERARFAARRPPGAAPRVLVVPGAYGTFHGPVVAALEQMAPVTVADLGRSHPLLKDRLLDPEVLPSLATMTAAQEGADMLGRRSTWDYRGPEPEQVTYRAVRDAVGAHDVVFCDWADRSAVWVTHACPPRVRVVLRLHGLDVLDPWLHLVRWDRVTEVVVSAALRSLVEDLLAGLGAGDVVVHTLPVLDPLQGMTKEKRSDARRTLGMVGWGRMVKDPGWALDLLERLSGFRLVLIGDPFPEQVPPPAREYARSVTERIAAMGDRVVLRGRTDDVAEELRDVGFILSSSLREGFHLGLLEGAASGAVPIVRDWPLLARRGGARSVYPDSWVVEDLAGAVTRVVHHQDEETWCRERVEAQRLALTRFDPDRVADEIRDIVLGEC